MCELPATYDLNTPIGKVRFYIPDTDPQNPIFSDEEIDFALAQNGMDPRLAAATCLEVIAGDPRRITQYSRGGVGASYQTAEAIRARAAELRREAKGANVARLDVW